MPRLAIDRLALSQFSSIGRNMFGVVVRLMAQVLMTWGYVSDVVTKCWKGNGRDCRDARRL